MYAVCTYKMHLIFGIAPLLVIARIFLIAALAAWLLTFLSMLLRPLYVVLLVLRGFPVRTVAHELVTMPINTIKGEESHELS
jgi:hypothetical protein